MTHPEFFFSKNSFKASFECLEFEPVLESP